MKQTPQNKFEVKQLSESEGGGFLVTFPDLPGCMSDGDSIEEAISNAADTETEWLVAAKELADEAGSANDAATASKQLGRLYFVRAVEVQKVKKWKEVLADAKRSVEYDGTNAQAQKLMGIAGVELKDWDTAIAGLEAALTADPNAKDKNNTIYRLAVSYEAKKNTAKACEYYKQLLGDANYKATADHKIKNELKCN